MKTCSKCKLEQSLDEFYNRKTSKDGKDYWCKSCHRSYEKSDAGRERNRRFNQTDKGKAVAYRRNHSDKMKGWQKKYNRSDKGRKKRREYNQLPQTKASKDRYANSKEGREKKRTYAIAHKAKFPEKYQAKSAVGTAVANGSLIRPDKCSLCDNRGVIHGHHESYAREHWLDIVWVCRSCHRNIHLGNIIL